MRIHSSPTSAQTHSLAQHGCCKTQIQRLTLASWRTPLAMDSNLSAAHDKWMTRFLRICFVARTNQSQGSACTGRAIPLLMEVGNPKGG
jgi:hypothetical protein